jgi:TolB protein
MVLAQSTEVLLVSINKTLAVCINKMFTLFFKQSIFCSLLLAATLANAKTTADIAYLRFDGDYWQVWVTDPKGTQHRQITRDKMDKTRVSWSPTRKQLLVDSNDGNLAIIDVSTLEKTPIALDSLEVFDAKWSPDGLQIAYTATTSLQADNAEVWVANTSGTDKKKITNNTAVALSPAWNPKNKSILFSAGSPGKNQELWEVTPETGKSEQLTISHASSLDPSVNAAGQILYSSDETGHYAIWLLDKKQKKQQLTKPVGYDAQPSWSANGKSFAFFRIVGTKKQIWVHDLKSHEEYAITPDNVLSRSPAWTN